MRRGRADIPTFAGRQCRIRQGLGFRIWGSGFSDPKPETLYPIPCIKRAGGPLAHHLIPPARLLRKMLEEAGFEVVEMIDRKELYHVTVLRRRAEE